MTNVEALKLLYTAFGGSAEDVALLTTNVEVLNAIAENFSGTSTAITISEAIANIAEVADAIGKSKMVLATKTITATKSKQTLTPASDNADGYGTITVNAVTAAIDSNIAAGNIKHGVTILGVTGTYEGDVTPSNNDN